MKKRIEKYFEDNRNNLLAFLSEIIAVPSVRSEEKPGLPFGENCAEALSLFLKKAESYGFITRNIDNYAGEIDFDSGEPSLAVMCHLDVVPAGDGWKTDPFTMTEKDGIIYGRGTSDDKGPAVAALYAMKCLKDLGVKLKKNVRFIVGSAEETGSEDIEYYLTKRKMPPMVFTPDSSFPVTNVERGRFSSDFSCAFPDENRGVESFNAGIAANAVPTVAKAVLKGYSLIYILGKLSSYSKPDGIEFKALPIPDNKIEITAEGLQAHASTPEAGRNPITALIEFLGDADSESESCRIFKNLSALFPHGDYHGRGLGIDMEDKQSGRITMTLDMLNTENGVLTGVFDCRRPVCATRENLSLKVRDSLQKAGFTLACLDFSPVHIVDENSPFIKKLLNSYTLFTGNEGYCEAIGGGTYVHEIEGGVAFGAVMPGRDTNMHGNGEYIPVDELLKAGEIFAMAIYDICSQD